MTRVARLTIHAALAVVTLGVFVPHHGRGLMLYDLGELLLYTQAFLDGRTPGTDFVVNGYGPGRYLLIAALSTVTGAAPLATAFSVFIALRVGISALAFELAHRLLGPRWTPWALFPPALLLIAPGPLHKGFFLLGSLALGLGVVWLLEHPTRRRTLGFGVLVAVCALFRVDLGLFGALALALVSAQVGSLAAFGWGAVAPALGWGLLVGGLLAAGDGVLATVAGQVQHDVLMNQTIAFPTFPGPVELVASPSLDRALLWLPFVVLALGVWCFLRLSRERARPFLVVLLLAVLTCNQVRMKPEFGHLLQSGPLLWVVLAVAAARAWGERSTGGTAEGPPLGRRLGALVPGTIALLVPVLLVVNTVGSHFGSVYTGSFTIPVERSQALETVAGTLLLADHETEQIAPLLQALERAPRGALWVPSNQPLLHALSGREEVTGYVGVLYVAHSDARQADLLRRLEETRPPVAVFVDDSMEGPERALRNAAPPVFAYLREHYAERERHGEFVVMVRRQGPRGGG